MEVCNVLNKGQPKSDTTIEALVPRILHLIEAIPNLAQMVWRYPNPIIRYLRYPGGQGRGPGRGPGAGSALRTLRFHRENDPQ